MPTAAVVADTHLPRGSRRLPVECLRRLAEADLILHAGDIATEEALALLEELGPVHAVAGNVDELALRCRLPERTTVQVGSALIGLVHDAGPAPGRPARLTAAFPCCHVVVYGHTHLPELVRAGGVWVLNPGSPTERRRAPTRSMGLIRVEDERVEPELLQFP